MIRKLLMMPLLLAAAAGGFLYWHYGEVEPCKVLAKDKAMESSKGLIPIDTEGLHRFETSQYSTGKCAGELTQRWWDRIVANKG